MMPLAKRFKVHRHALIIAGGVLVLLTVGGYVWWSNSAWASYHASNERQAAQAKASIDAALKLSVNTTEERTKKLDALVAATSFEDMPCKVNVMLGWQQVMSETYKQWQQKCVNLQKTASTLHMQLSKVTVYLKSEHALATTLSAALAATRSKVTEANLATVLAKWKTASGEIKGMASSKEFDPVKEKAQKAADGVVSAWQAVISAHTTKNEANYEKAVKTLPAAYSAIDIIERESVKQFTLLGDALQVSYDAF